MKKLFVIITVILAFMMIGSECIFGSKDSEPHEISIDLSSPGATLQSLCHVYTVTRNIDEYKRLLVPSSYQYYFDPNDVGQIVQGYTIPASWTYQEDVSATGNMFNEAYRIELTIPDATLPAYTTEFDQSLSEFRADNINIQLYLYPEDESFAYLAAGPCDFEFLKVGTAWQIKTWYDRTASGG